VHFFQGSVNFVVDIEDPYFSLWCGIISTTCGPRVGFPLNLTFGPVSLWTSDLWSSVYTRVCVCWCCCETSQESTGAAEEQTMASLQTQTQHSNQRSCSSCHQWWSGSKLIVVFLCGIIAGIVTSVRVILQCLVKSKVFPYSLPSVGPGGDPGVQAVSPQVTWSESRHIPGSRLPLLSAGLAVTSVAFTRWRYL